MQERLQKILSQAGIASRRESEKIITDGRVAVNGTVVTELGTKADPDNDLITVDGKPLTIEENRAYILLYKPVGYMTTMKDPEGRPIVTDLLKRVKERVYPIGRLDYNTEGLLLLTNDGALANMLMHPSHEVDKGYLVRVSGHVAEEQLQRLSDGVQLEDGMTAPAKVHRVSESEHNSWISITIHEGRYRQVRRMCEAVGLSVVRLKRSRYDFLEIGDLKPGEYRQLTDGEVARLKRKTSSSSAGAPRKTGMAAQRMMPKGDRAVPQKRERQGETQRDQSREPREQRSQPQRDREREPKRDGNRDPKVARGPKAEQESERSRELRRAGIGGLKKDKAGAAKREKSTEAKTEPKREPNRRRPK